MIHLVFPSTDNNMGFSPKLPLGTPKARTHELTINENSSIIKSHDLMVFMYRNP